MKTKRSLTITLLNPSIKFGSSKGQVSELAWLQTKQTVTAKIAKHRMFFIAGRKFRNSSRDDSFCE